jgi:hypothetical protein
MLFQTIRAFYPANDLSDEERRIVDAVLFKKGVSIMRQRKF